MKIDDFDVKELINIYYKEKPENAAGGNFHIVFDDGNIENKDILFCIELASEDNDMFGVTLGYLFLSLPYKQRERIYYQLWSY